MKTRNENDLFDGLTDYFTRRLAQARVENEDGKIVVDAIDPRELAEMRKHAEYIKEKGMGLPGSRASALVNNVARAVQSGEIDESKLKLTGDEEAA